MCFCTTSSDCTPNLTVLQLKRARVADSTVAIVGPHDATDTLEDELGIKRAKCEAAGEKCDQETTTLAESCCKGSEESMEGSQGDPITLQKTPALQSDPVPQQDARAKVPPTMCLTCRSC